MWEEISKSVKSVLYDRISSPLVGAFAVSWALWNYRFLTVLISGMEPIAKFETIDTALYPTLVCVLLRMIAFPLLTTIAFIYLYPYPARLVYKFAREQQKQLKNIRQRIEDETPLTAEESKVIRSAALQAELRYEKDMQVLTEENQQLRVEIQKLLAQEKQTPEKTQPIRKGKTVKTSQLGEDLSEDAVDVLVSLSKNEGIEYNQFIQHLTNTKTMTPVKAQHLLDKLKSGNYVTHRSYNDTLVLKEGGRELLVARGLA